MSTRKPADPAVTRPFATLVALAASFASRGERSAVVAFGSGETETWSYARLAAAIARVALGLRARGICHGDRVALLGPNSPEWIVAYFGIIAAGAVAAPLDPQGASESTAAALAHASPKALVTTRAQRDALVGLIGTDVPFWLLDSTGDESVSALRAAAAQGELPRVGERDLASLLFTSGTTGTPKAVPLTHANLATNVGALLAAQIIDAHDRVLLPLPLHHTYPFTVGLLMTLATGATLLLPAGISGPEILQACTSGRPTALVAVPRLCALVWEGVQTGVRARGAAAARVFDALLAASVSLHRYAGLRVGRWLFRAVHARFGSALRVIGCGGAALPREIAWNLEGLGFRVLTGYGLTETSPVLTFNSRRHSKLGSAGRPLLGVELRIAGAASDTPGEILARGPSVFAGYWNDPSATAPAFTQDGWFRTGDLGRLDEDGFLHVVGRSKELIVLADGKKFFPEPIEKAYAKSPLVREVGVFERGGLLVGLAVPNEDEIRLRGTLSEAASLRDELESAASRLPRHQRITSYRVVRAALPRTQLGKLRRHLLPGLFNGTAGERSSQPPTLSDEDRALLVTPLGGAVWQWLRERYSEHELTLDTSPQLDLAIDSLAWVTLTVEIEQRFHVALRAERLSRILTLRDLLRELEAAAQDAAAPHQAGPAFVQPGPVLRAMGAVVLMVARALARVGWHPVVTGIEHLPSGAALITPNHASYLDPLVVAAALPWRRLRRAYWAGWVGVMHTSPLRRLVSRAAQVFPVDPDRDLAAAVQTAAELLRQGHDVVWFPEGRRSPTGELQQFRAGVGILAKVAGTPVVPTAIAGTFAAWPRHRRWPRPGRVRVAFGPPIEIANEPRPAEIGASIERVVRTLIAAPCVTEPVENPEIRASKEIRHVDAE